MFDMMDNLATAQVRVEIDRIRRNSMGFSQSLCQQAYRLGADIFRRGGTAQEAAEQALRQLGVR